MAAEPTEDSSAAAAGETGEEVAIVGMAGRFPGAADVDRLWENLRDGVDSIATLSDAELLAAGVSPGSLADPRYVRARGVVDGVELFDAPFFGFSPREAALTDPQHRVFLECAWEALEEAGVDPERFAGRIGVYAGSTLSTYLLFHLLPRLSVEDETSWQAVFANDKDSLATRVSYKLNLKGPSVAVQTACSTSLVAVHLARQSLLDYECDLALAGGVAIRSPQTIGYLHQESWILSPDGRCRTFDAGARGTVFGGGAGVVVLKRLADALADGDGVRAVLKGSAINNDGAERVGFTAPGEAGQAEVVSRALAIAGVPADTVQYVEAHGTATPLGDPIEIAALTRAFRAGTARRGFCAVGSIKTNVGHLDAAAGVAGLIKTVLALERREIPASLHFERPNPRIDFAASPFYVNDRLRPWPAGAGPSGPAPRRAGVSSFGMGGTNAHVVVEEAPAAPPAAPSTRPRQLLLLSARTETALARAAARLAEHLRRAGDDLADVAYTLQVGRRELPWRRAVVAGSREAAIADLDGEANAERSLTGAQRDRTPSVAFYFPGQGARWGGAGRELYRAEPVFRREIDRSAEALRPLLAADLRAVLFPEDGWRGAGEGSVAPGVAAQVSLVAVELALAHLWISWGVRPEAMIGHSLGEYVAAHLAGVLSREDMLALVVARAELLAPARGAMLVLPLAEAEVLPLLARAGPALSLAAVNGPQRCVVSGPAAAVEALAAELAARGIEGSRLAVEHAFHSALVEPAVGPLVERVQGVALQPPRIPYLSGVTGDWIRAEEATDPAYWGRHLRQTVRFAAGMERLLAAPDRVLVRVGPRGAKPGETGGERSEFDDLLLALGRLWVAGVAVDWASFHVGERRRRVRLPTYPFERQRHWVELAPSRQAAGEGSAPALVPPLAPPLPDAAGEADPDTDLADDPTTRGVAEIWRQVLGGPRIRAADRFLDLGGDSLVAIQATARLREVFGVELPIAALFAHATVPELAAAIDAALAERAAAPAQAAEPPLARRSDATPSPLSFGQERLWFLDRLEPGSAAYNLAAGVRIDGRLAPEMLAAALHEVARRHESLRTRLVLLAAEPREPVQAIDPPAPVPLPRVDLRGLPAERLEAESRRLAQAEALRPFDLAAGPLLRATLLASGAREHRLLLTLHHAVADGWSLEVLLRELGLLYAAFARRQASPLPALPIQYADFAVWQRQRMSGEALAADLAYFRERLAGSEALDLPTDLPRPPVQSFRGGLVPFALDGPLLDDLRELSRREGATLFMTLLAGLQALLARYSGQEAVSVGTPVAGRTRRETEGLIGLFVNTLVLRVDLGGGPGFAAALSRVREAALGAFAHQELPFELLVGALAPQRSLAMSPLFQVFLALLKAPPPPSWTASGLALTPLEPAEGTAKFDLQLALVERPEALAGTLEYAADLFERTTVARFGRHLRTLLARAATAPERPLPELSPLADAEVHQAILEWSDTAAGGAGWETPLPRRFAAAAARHPERTALSHGEASLTYGELALLSGRLAARLRELGVGPEVRVGIFAGRSLEMVVALLAVLAAGGAYVPLDPAFPAERLAFVFADSACAVLLSERALADRLPSQRARVVWLDGLGGLGGEPLTAESAPLDGESLAYVIYTSGSTGVPKGVGIPHRALANFLAAMGERPGLGAGETFLSVTTISFDIAALELFLPLLNGGRVVLADREAAADGRELAALVARSQATAMQATPVAWQLLAAAGGEGLAGLRALCGGEALPAGLAARLRERTRSLWNLYGPTETTVWSAVEEAGLPAPVSGTIPIGRPIGNTRLAVLDRAGRPLPLGVPGELHIGGAGVARGYLGRPELTAERFVPDDLGARDDLGGAPGGARLYRTGDLARALPDGRLEFLGRLDRQVKLRGLRIELGEIEAALAACPGVAEAAVVVRERGEGDRALMACVVAREPAGEPAPTPAALRTRLAERLPAYMVPAAFAFLPALPLTPNGKVDRKALARLAPDAGGEVGPTSSTPPSPLAPITEILAGIFAEVLGVARVGAGDGFFDLGGHSLSAMRLVARVREALGVELPVRSVFEAPSPAGLAAAVERLGAGGAPRLPAIEPAPRDRPLPLSFAQERLWFLDRLEPGGSAYNLPQALRLRGPLAPAALGAALRAVAGRHEVLRTTFPLAGEQPVQEIAAGLAAALPEVDLRRLPEAAREREALALLAAEARRPFDLARGPLLRTLILRLAAAEHLLLFVLHHTVADGWSVALFAAELAAFYGEATGGTARVPLAIPPAIPLAIPLAIQYADFAVWQRGPLSEILAGEIAYWRERLAGAPDSLELPADRPRPAVWSGRGARLHAAFDPRLAGRLRELGRRQGTTLFMTLLAAYQALLARATGADDLSIGVPVSGRRQVETEALIGLFVNLVVLRADLSGDPTFAALAAQARAAALAAFAHQDAPFEKVVEALRPERRADRSPLFQVQLVFQNVPVPDLGLPGLQATPVELPEPATKHDLTLTLWEEGGGLRGMVEYARDLFDRSTVARLVGHLGVLLEGACADAGTRLAALPLLAPAERQQLREWNDTREPVPGPCLHELVFAQAARAPDAAALEWEGGALSYGELAARAASLAGELTALGVAPEARVALAVERSPEMVVGILATLAAGGAYVPLDPSYPVERLAAMLADARAAVLLTSRALRPGLPPFAGPVIVIDELASAVAAPPRSENAAEGLAYVIFTSGSTGWPKGVMVSHRAIGNRVAWTARHMPLAAGDVVLQKTSMSFDPSLVEIFLPLVSGARLALARPGGQRDGAYLLAATALHGVTWLQLVPSQLAILLAEEGVAEEGIAARCRSLRWLYCGGEALPVDLVERFRARCGAAVYNLYGPTEASVDATCRPAAWGGETAGAGRRRLEPIGRPLGNVQVLLLDRGLRPVPAGVPGELHIGGTGLARGYLGRPELTAERFVPHPEPEAAGERLYATGDLARHLPNGELEYLGRLDGQVKLRGFRIEMGEIETALEAHPAVVRAAVVAAGDGVERRLVAYWAAADAGGDERELRAFLAARLPEFMLPAVLVRLPALPLMPSGKIDRRALSARPVEPPREALVAPRTPLEETIAAVWADVLGRERVGVEESFFDLGGHSLLATQVISRLRGALGIDLPLRRLFEGPTVAGLAAAVAEERAASRGLRLPPLRRDERPGPSPLSFAQERLWFLDQLEPGGSWYNVPLALRLSGRLDAPLLAACLTEIARRHEVLRARFAVPEAAAGPAGGPLQTIAPPSPWRPPLLDLAGLPPGRREAEARRLALAEAERPFDLARGPLFRGALLRLALETPEEHLALLTLHHVVTDGWSLGILVAELGALYAAGAAGLPSPLPELAVQYADFARWQRAWLAGAELERQLAFWRGRLAGAPAALDLPTDRPRPPVARSRGAARPFAVDAGVAAGLARLAHRRSATLFMALLAGFQSLVSRLSGQTDVVVGVAIANRNHPEIEGLIGFFVNTLPLRADLADDPGFAALVERTREAALGAYDHQDLPLEKLVADLGLPRDPSRSPVFQAVLQLQNARASRLALPGLELAPVERTATTAKFELVLDLYERGAGLGEIAGTLQYNTDLFDATTAERLLAQYARLLEGAAADPAAAVSALPLLSAAERHQALREWSSTGPAEPLAAMTLAHLFARRAAERPDAVAATAGEAQLTYGELAARAGRLAGRLARCLGAAAGPGARVGLLAERSLAMVVGIVGVLRSGAAYVPLDPDYPAERLRFALADSGVAAVVAAGGAAVPELPAGVRLLRLEEEEEGGEAAPAPEPELAGTPEDGAYVIYTSGSTGVPKGVAVAHGNVLSLLAATSEEFGFGPADVWTLFHSYAFDFSVWELWGALAHGGRLVVVPYWVSRSPEAFRDLLAREQATVLNQTPAAFQQLARAELERPRPAGTEGAAAGRLPALRTVVFGGERLELASLAPWWERQGDLRPLLVNMYGITETTVHVTRRPLRAADAALGSRIGRPLRGFDLYLLDAHLQPVALGAPGEIVVGGAGVAAGYLGRPELTAARFVPDGLSGACGARLYRSGDLGRHRPDGDLEVLGRIDRQVKLRGFRIELGEIEAALRRCPGVRDAAVLVVGATAEDRRLVACVVPAVPETGAPPDLQASLAASLPDYMVPASVVALDGLPLTPNGKLDREALARAVMEAADGAAAASSWESPRTALEVFLAGLFGEVLGRRRIGLDDDFFALGGNSIRGAVLVNRLQQELAEIVHVVAIFSAPTVRRLAAYLAAEHAAVVARRWPENAPDPSGEIASRRISPADVAAFRRLIVSPEPVPPPEPRNPPAVFVLSPPRSGSTLLRVLLGGHGRLFAPPELELLGFGTLAERAAAFAAPDRRFWLEGVVRAVMEVRGCDGEAAAALLAAAEREGRSTAWLYGRLQEWLGERLLVDKTPSYALDPAVLARAEAWFERPLYLHLTRHPYGMIHSFEEAKLDQIVFQREHPFGRRELAELIWRVSEENVLRFLAGVPPERQLRVSFEELVASPEDVLRGICSFLGIAYEPAMAEPYDGRRERMTDGVHAESRMLGDVKFHLHRTIDAAAAERWRSSLDEDFLEAGTWEVAEALGYRRRDLGRPAAVDAIGSGRWQAGEPLAQSFAQERLWFLDQMEPGSPAYNIPLAVALDGALAVPALAASLAEIVRRHASLRTSFAAVLGRPVQAIAPAVDLALRLVDLAGLPRPAAEAEARRLGDEEAARPFDLRRAPLLRAALVRLAPRRHLALLTVHHIVADGWSMGVLVAELGALYAAARRGAASPLAELPIQYADFALWQRGWLAGPELERQLAYWRERLAGAPAALDLPADRPRPAELRYRGASRPVALPATLAGELRRLARAGDATLFMALLAGFQALVSRLAGQPDVVVGSPFANRNRAEVEPLIGFFVNTLPLRADLADEPGFAALLARAREAALGALAHQDLPFEKLVAELRLPRDPSRSPVFQVVVQLQNAPPVLALPDLELAPFRPAAESAKFDLVLGLLEPGAGVGGGIGGIGGTLQYNTDLFDATTAERLLGAYERLLAGAAADPSAAVTELSLLSSAERHQLLREWAWPDAVDAWRTAPTLARLLARQAAARPEAVALTLGEAQMSYGELAARAARLAGRLAAVGADRGAGRGARVGLLAERSLEMVTGLAGILWAGAAYVPLDPGYPAERLRFALADSGVAAVVASGDVAMPELPAGVPLLRLEAGGDEVQAGAMQPAPRPAGAVQPAPGQAGATQPAPGPAGAPLPSAGPEDVAYVIYTSGSTGVPKGVEVTHGNVLALLAATAGDFALGSGDVWTLFHSYAFDFSVWEIWGALAHGGRLVVVPYLVSRSPEAFADLLAREGATVLSQTPSAFQQLVAALAERRGAEHRMPERQIPQRGSAERRIPPPLPALRWVVFGGEALSPPALAPWWALAGESGAGLVNMYGITETTVHVTFRRLRRREVAWSAIGAPLAHLSARTLDRRGMPVPLGVPGELCVGGAGVARGYLGRPDLTALRFVPDPFAGEAGGGGGARLYRSGDLARWRWSAGAFPWGAELEYLGRIDQQVKVRGFRIEPGEIEAALAAHPAVAQAAVVVRRDGPGEARLVAYVVPREAAPAVDALRRHLAARLPEHMVPAAFVALPALPLTANGKLDRAALPAPGAERPDLEQELVAPATDAEAALAAVWAEVLGLAEVGARDNFFALGGDSLLAIRAVALAGERGLAFEVQDLFRHQTVAELAANLSGADGAGGGGVQGQTAPFSLLAAEDRARLPEDAVDAYPLARLQAGMLYHMTLAPEDPPYHNVDSFRLRMRFDEAAFRAAVARVVARHPILRTSFDLGGGEPLQRVHREAELPIVVEDLRHLPEAEQRQAVAALIDAEKRRLFDLARPPQLRFHVFRLGPDEVQFTLTENHAIFDGWSLHSTLAEIFALQSALLRGEAPEPAPPLVPTYRDFVARERETLASPAAQAFWAAALEGAPYTALAPWPGWPLATPADPPPRVRGLFVLFPPAVAERLQALARRAAAPLKSVLLAAHLKTLSLAVGEREVVTGLVANGRLEEAGGDDVRGLFLNTLPLRLDLACGSNLDLASGSNLDLACGSNLNLACGSNLDLVSGSWVDLVRAAERAELAMLPFRRFPLAELQRRAGDRPLFEAAFNYIHFHVVRSVLRSGEVEVAGFERAEGNHFKLTLSFGRPQDGAAVSCDLEYDSRALPRRQAEAIGELLSRVVAAMVEEPDAPHEALSPLTAAERHQVLVEWNDTAAAPDAAAVFAGARLLHEPFERQAARRPGVPAIAGQGVELTYGELDARANRLARHLRWLGVGPEARVGLAVERSPAMVVALLAILKAGGAYVPLDPAQPAERLGAALADAAVGVLVTESARRERLAEIAGERIVVCLDGPDSLDGDAERIAAEESVPLAPTVTPESLAYVIFTSGSTGRPKGVELPHRAVVDFLAAMAERPGLGAGDVVPALTTLTFDIAGLEIYLPLAVGGRVEVVGKEEGADGRLLAERIAASGVTAMQATPASWHLLLASGWEGKRGLTALSGGEALSRELAAALLARGARLWNLYGPTETAVWSAVRRVAGEGDLPASGAVGLGRPIAKTRLYVVDRDLRPVLPAVAGELLIGGAGVARGYGGRPDLTAERFVPDPWGNGERLYRTGDLVRRRPDGDLEFLGRIDHQVKVRGFRIELGEVEAALRRHPAVGQAVVMARGDEAARRLVAYVVAAAGEREPSAAELRAACLATLPEYMVPAAFVFLASLPLGASGKVDRRALPDLESEGEDLDASYAAPRTPLEELLAGMWADLLGRARVGVEDSFFDLGGHSLLATQVVGRVRAALGVELSLRQLFAAPTVAGLAAAVAAARQAALAPPIAPAPRTPRLPLSYAQERLWLTDRMAREELPYALPVALRLRGDLRPAALAATLREIVRRHEALRTRFVAVGGRPFQEVDAGWRPELPRIDLGALPTAAAERELRRLLSGDEGAAFDLARGPLLRASLIQMPSDPASGDFALSVTLHHIVSDGWSMGVLLRELAAIYPALAAGEPPPLPELAIQYADFAVWQRGWLAGKVFDEQLAYWRRELGGLAPLALPSDRSPAAGRQGEAGALAFDLPADLAAGVRALARRHGATLFMALLAVFDLLLHRLSGQDDLAVGTPIANRNRPEVEPLIGFFVNTLVLRSRLDGGRSLRAQLAATREATLAAYDHQDLPFALVVEALRPDRRGGRMPFLDAMFVLQRPPLREIEIPGLELTPLSRSEGADLRAQSLLVLTVAEMPERLAGLLSYDAGRIARETALRWQGHWLTLLAAALAEPERPLAELPLLSAAERHQLLVEWGGGEVVLAGDLPAALGVWGELCLRGPGGALERTGRRTRRTAEGGIELAREAREIGEEAELAAVASAADGPGDGLGRARSELAKRRDDLSEAKRRLLAQRLGKR